MPELLEATDVLPARMLNEFTYCPRLAYLEWVQGEWADNPDTLDGAFVHRNADRPDHQPIAAPAGAGPDAAGGDERFHARSVRLESAEVGLVAVVDGLEVEGEVVTPVDRGVSDRRAQVYLKSGGQSKSGVPLTSLAVLP